MPSHHPAPPRSRRQFIALVPALGALSWCVRARADTLLKETDPEAIAMDYRADAGKVDAIRFPKFKPGQTCANCALYGGDQGAASGPCGLFMFKDVTAIGWCNAWEKKA
ncbi:MAG: high-potential iron-sulfur protein [Aquabacterium sp.]|nr:high-potential iron-sulfur protein [Aquabacterium sp.]